jgi:hypothetical protein
METTLTDELPPCKVRVARYVRALANGQWDLTGHVVKTEIFYFAKGGMAATSTTQDI